MPKFIVVDATGKFLRDLDAKGVVVGEVVGVGDTPGPVAFLFDSAKRVEHTPPFFISGEKTTGVPNPWPVKPGLTMHIQVLAGVEYAEMDIMVPVAASPPSPPPPSAAPPMRYIDAVPQGPNRGWGVDVSKLPNINGTITLKDTFVRYHAQNVVAENIPKNVTIFFDNVRSTAAWRNDPSNRYEGQTFYLAGCGRVKMRGCWGGSNLFPDRAPNRNSPYIHGGYQNATCDYLDVQWSAFGDTPNAGIEFKGAGQICDSLLFKCGTGLLGLRGAVKPARCVIFDGHRYAAGTDSNNNVTAWTGNSALQSYCDFKSLDGGPPDICIVGGPTQNAPDFTPAPAHDMGCLNGSRQYGDPPIVLEDGTTPPGASWHLNGVHVCKWKGALVSGDTPPDVATIDTTWVPAAIPSIDEILRRLNDPKIRVQDTVMWVFNLMKVPWLSTYNTAP